LTISYLLFHGGDTVDDLDAAGFHDCASCWCTRRREDAKLVCLLTTRWRPSFRSGAPTSARRSVVHRPANPAESLRQALSLGNGWEPASAVRPAGRAVPASWPQIPMQLQRRIDHNRGHFLDIPSPLRIQTREPPFHNVDGKP